MSGSTPDQSRGFFARLFDVSFRYVVTPTVIRVIFVISLVLLAIEYLGFVASGFHQSGTAGFVALVFSPILIFLQLLWIRVILELIMAVFRIASNTEMSAIGSGPSAVPPSPGYIPHTGPETTPVPPPPPAGPAPAAAHQTPPTSAHTAPPVVAVPAASSPPVAPTAPTPSPVPQAPPASPPTWCTNCGTALAAGDRFCPSCGSASLD